MKITDIDSHLLQLFRKGTVIPATPLALTKLRTVDEKYQKALVRYHIDCGVGGIAIGVHSTQFEIREHGLFEGLLSLVSEEIDKWSEFRGKKILKIAGVCGKTEQALKEATFASSTGYHAALVSLSALKENSLDELILHCRQVAEIMPIIGFYMQTSVGGINLPYEFWKEFAAIPNVLGIKIAPFDRYKTFDVVRAICDVEKEKEITLYTGNDDNIVADLLSEYKIETSTGTKNIRIKGGLLGHWCVWTKKAVELLDEIHSITESGKDIPQSLLTRAIQITDSNAAFFDSKNKFAGCIPGLHEVLFRQGLMTNTLCLNPEEVLSDGQKEEISRVYNAYPHLNDDDFVRSNLSMWLK
ncbi:dihydrodipicolinate synthase/N-acetylneuraminate lyase [Dysgonomonas hofstadii]|uniref:Dihydrodipicolinate synthase/N-acetylneuraminate lyase n=1 Tax=Dysgonomonas hofstadii TaxID=637886 RepID=A0A840CIB5_9BACT|nr:dihydrodipicolinate synthase family protein [Dysgonomonas hofstadii]MBB4034941.1 dihydrodipicolinate synthase/N-acetylneuraminate lyase [Dysgonomonas hofstadii]